MAPHSMARGLVILKNENSRVEFQIPTWKLRPRQQSLSQSAKALSRYYRKMSEVSTLQDTKPQDLGFMSQMERLQKAFLKRPGCPQLNTRATSMSHCGLPTRVTVPEETGRGFKYPCMTKVSVSCEKLHRTESAEQLLPVSKSACELSYLRRSSSESLSPVSSSLGLEHRVPQKRTPWYITVIHDKEHCLMMLVEELQRFSRLEAQLQKKDQEIRELQEKQEQLRKQLRAMLHTKGQESSLLPKEEDLEGGIPKESLQWGSAGDFGQCHLHPFPAGLLQMQEDDSTSLEDEDDREEGDRGLEQEVSDFKDEDLELGQDLDGVSRSSLVLEQEEVLDEEEDEVLELEEEEEQEMQHIRRSLEMDHALHEELLGQLQELEQVMQEFQEELEVTRNNYSLATGAITTLLRQVEYQESQLRKVNTENEKLEKELRERKHQLRAMSDKFSNLREEKKQVELLGQTEKENMLLRQQVSMLEEELLARDKTILELSDKVTGLQGQTEQQLSQLQRWGQLQEELQAKMEVTRQDEQQTRVALESTQARLERLRNKILQATFSSTSVNKTITAEITDSDILESLQTIISERSEHLGQLKQKGPPRAAQLNHSESGIKAKKATSK
ncbi:coiled-coil domain-containing protein 27 [Sorex fumeus]|uniref:coiled-coil domain-containing protein 27 n=1 Tax=Sorex fumeus TaxID=62283 RepID=UPI0024AE6B89|nr:coiled-coil domain-containing protein 27 [Sorex fumeus]